MSETHKRPGSKPFDARLVFEAADGIWKSGDGRVPELKDIQLLVKGTTQKICDAFQDWSARRLGVPLPTPVPSALAKAIADYVASEKTKIEVHWRDVVEALRNDIQNINLALSESEEAVQLMTENRDNVHDCCEQLKGQIKHQQEFIAQLQKMEVDAREKITSEKMNLVECNTEREFILRQSNSLEEMLDQRTRERDRYRDELTAEKVELAAARAILDTRFTLPD